METTAIKLRQVRKIKDRNRFNVDNIQHYNLSVQFGLHDLQLCVTDTRKNRVLLLEDYIYQGVTSYEKMVEVLSKLYDEHHVLSVAFWKSVKVVFKNRQFALVPSSVFLKEEADAYLSLNAAVDQDRDKVMYYKHSQHKAVNVFASEQIVLDFLRDKYPNGNLQVFHQSSALVEGLMKYDDHSSQRTMFLYIDRFYLHIAVCKDHQLEYYNLFSIRKSEDYVRYILGVMQAMKMSQSKAKVVLWGFIKPQSNHFKFLHKYVRNLSFGQRPEFLKFSFDFDELHDNQYFDVLNAYLCE